MPIATFDISGTKLEFFYTDTGPVDSTSYTTLVVYHGTAFTSKTFCKLLPFIPSSNVRLVIVTRRGYDSYDKINSPGSTPHTDEEIEEVQAGREAALEHLALEQAGFLLWFADVHKIPKISDDGKSGGFSVMGWSFGSIGALALLGHPDVVPKESQQKLALYFRQLILYDPAEAIFGFYFGHEDGIYPAAVADFPIWASRYYVHPDLTSRAGAAATTVDSSKPPSFKNMTDEDIAINFDLNAALKLDVPMALNMLPALEKQTQAAFFNETLAKGFLPALQLVWISCRQSMWTVEWCKVLMERRFEELVRQKHLIRKIKFTEIEGANHFVHWDEPEKFWAATVSTVLT